MRHMLRSIDIPIHWLLGAKDGLVPASLAAVLSQEYHQPHVILNADASHAPFISHREDFLRQLVSIAQNLRK
jgi:pimeloyl-ACP methyl ester carboxylesterase